MTTLSDERVIELYNHSKKLIVDVGCNVGVAFNWSYHTHRESSHILREFQGCDIPFLTQDSKLLWYPSISVVCVSPINEVEGEDEDGKEDFSWGPRRPLFYTEIKAKGFLIVKQRCRIRHRRIIQLINSNEASF